METVRVVMINLLVMIFFTTVLDLLLPEGSLRSYLKMTMGFFVMLTLLQPVLQLADPDNMAQKWQLSVPTVAGADNAAVQGEVYEAQVREMEQLYQQKLQEQSSSLLLLSTDLEQFQVACAVEGQCLKKVTVQIPLGEEVDSRRIAQALSGYYGLAAEQITVEIKEDGWNELEESE